MRVYKKCFVAICIAMLGIVAIFLIETNLAEYFTLEILNLIQIITNFATVCAALAAFMTMKATKNTTTGEFILNLQQEFSSGYGIEVYTACWNAYVSKQKYSKTEVKNLLKEDNNRQAKIVNYLTFFESLYIMYQKKILSLDELDDLFGRRFFVVVNNREVQNELGGDNYKYYLNIYKLHAIWQLRRIWKKEELFLNAHNGCMNDLSVILNTIFDSWKDALKDAKKKNNKNDIRIYKMKIRSIKGICYHYKINAFVRKLCR